MRKLPGQGDNCAWQGKAIAYGRGTIARGKGGNCRGKGGNCLGKWRGLRKGVEKAAERVATRGNIALYGNILRMIGFSAGSRPAGCAALLIPAPGDQVTHT